MKRLLTTILVLFCLISCKEKKKNEIFSPLSDYQNRTADSANPIFGTMILGEEYNESKIFDTSKKFQFNGILNSWIYKLSQTKFVSIHPFEKNNILTEVDAFFNQDNPWNGFKDAIPKKDVKFYIDLYYTKYGKNSFYKKGIDSSELKTLIFSLVQSKFSFDPPSEKLNSSEIEIYKWNTGNFTITLWFQKLNIRVDSDDIYWGGVNYKLNPEKYKKIINSKSKRESDSIITNI